MILFRLIQLLLVTIASARFISVPGSLTKYAASAVTPLLRCFQVYSPVLTETTTSSYLLTDGYHDHSTSASPGGNASSCLTTQTLMVHSFGNSYGSPFVGPYTPPSCAFNRITFNLTVTAAGRQFDRISRVYFGDVELWRSSTAEPTQNGIIWTYIKDVTEYASLFRQPQKLIYELGNVVDDTYTAPFNVTLEATFFNADTTIATADQIIPISARLSSSNEASVWEVPSANATNTLTLPRNINRAVFTISATGQIDEEFWYTNVFSSQVDTFPGTTLLGYSPYREVQLLIDGQLAGVGAPFPIIFTGGIVPGLWRPLVGIDAFDLKETEIDISPWLPLLCDGNAHTYTIRIAGIADNDATSGQLTESVGSYWDVTGKIFLFLDSSSASITTGTSPSILTPGPAISLSSDLTKTSNGSNATLSYSTTVHRSLRVASTLHTASGTRNAAWIQSLTYSNTGFLSNDGNDQAVQQTTSGFDLSTEGYARHYSYPINVNSTYYVDPTSGNLTLTAVLSRGQDLITLGSPVFPTGLQSFAADQAKSQSLPAFQGARLSTTQNGSAIYTASGDNKYSASSGTTKQSLQFSGVRVDEQEIQAAAVGMAVADWVTGGSIELYSRDVVASNGSVVSDHESVYGRAVQAPAAQEAIAVDGGDAQQVLARSVRSLLGRGPRKGGRGA